MKEFNYINSIIPIYTENRMLTDDEIYELMKIEYSIPRYSHDTSAWDKRIWVFANNANDELTLHGVNVPLYINNSLVTDTLYLNPDDDHSTFHAGMGKAGEADFILKDTGLKLELKHVNSINEAVDSYCNNSYYNTRLPYNSNFLLVRPKENLGSSYIITSLDRINSNGSIASLVQHIKCELEYGIVYNKEKRPFIFYDVTDFLPSYVNLPFFNLLAPEKEAALCSKLKAELGERIYIERNR